MSKITLNGSPLSEEFEAPSLLELIVAVEEKEIPEDQIVTQVKVDGFNVTDFTHEDNTLVPYRTGSSVEITSEKVADIMKKSVDEFIRYLDKLLPGLKEIAAHYREDRVQDGNALYAEAMDGIRVMIELIQSMDKNDKLDISDFSHNGITLQTLYGELSGLVQQLVGAQTNQDYATLAQIMEGPACDTLRKWADMLPALREYLNQMD